jgi:hypothetical protein
LLLHVRQLGQSLEFEVGESIGGLPQRVLCSGRLGGRLLRLLGFEVALDLELAQIADERPRFAGQSIASR